MNFNPSLLTNWVPAKASYPVFVQPKLDGVRCIATRGGLFTRNGKAILAAPHVEHQLASFFRVHPDAVLDGELVHTSGCQATVSTLMRRDACSGALHYHVFDGAVLDVILEADFEDRFEDVVAALKGYDTPHVHLVETLLADCECDVRRAHAYWTAEGFEGAVIRRPVAPYCHGRTEMVQKLKVHQDSEFLCVAVTSTGCLRFAMKDGRTFEAQGAANFDLPPVGKMVTVRHNGLTDDGIPRHAVAHCLRAD